jgi:hypothetical protein
VDRANQALRDHNHVWEALGVTSKSLPTRKAQHAELSADSAAGRLRRSKLEAAVEGIHREHNAVGVEMNQHYYSDAVFLDDEADARQPLDKDPVLYYQPSTYPGSRLPHAWLNTAVPSKQLSTIDLAGKGRFTLFTGAGGDKWKDAARNVSKTLGVPIEGFSVGYRQDYEDVYFDWAKLRGVEESGCVLVRPDRFVAWRSMGVRDNCEERLLEVMGKILSR